MSLALLEAITAADETLSAGAKTGEDPPGGTGCGGEDALIAHR